MLTLQRPVPFVQPIHPRIAIVGLPETIPPGQPIPEPDAPGEARLPMADWIEVQASLIRLLGSDLAEWLAAKVDAVAAECRALNATTPAEFDARDEVMARDIAERDARDDHDQSNYWNVVLA